VKKIENLPVHLNDFISVKLFLDKINELVDAHNEMWSWRKNHVMNHAPICGVHDYDSTGQCHVCGQQNSQDSFKGKDKYEDSVSSE
jgi:hypothetical protein